MKAKKLLMFAIPAMAMGSLVGCAPKYDVKLIVYNWADYIFEGDKENPKTIKAFEQYYKEKHGLVLKVDYRTFATNEIMYTQVKEGSIKPDLICPSDYMIQKMANEGMLEKFSYDAAKDEYGESLQNWADNGSPFIKERFSSVKLNDNSSLLQYAVPYFWGTMGFTYDPNHFSEEEIGTWECLWNKGSKFQNEISLKDSMRDTYVAAIFHVYKDEIAALDENDPEYNAKLTAIFNRCDSDTIKKVGDALIEAKKSTVNKFEVDAGKEDIVKGVYHANLAWSGDAIFAMDSAEELKKPVTLNYALPKEGSNVWFDGWVMPKNANTELAEEFVNFICDPENAVLIMDAVGYTSPIVGDAMWEYVKETYEAEDDVEATDEIDLSFYFGKEAKINIDAEERGRQFDAQYPTEDVLKKCCMMNDFGTQQKEVGEMWARVKSA